MDHAPVICQFRYRCWLAITSQDHDRAFTKRELHDLNASLYLQRDMREYIEQSLEKEANQMEMALMADDVDAVWTIMTRSVKEAADLIRRELTRRRQSWHNQEVVRLEEK